MSTNGGVNPPPQASIKTHERYGPAGRRDIALISSDGVAFHVESMYLAVGSSVWRDMLAGVRLGESKDAVKEITLTDMEIEHSESLVALLDIFHCVRLPLPLRVYLSSTRRTRINLDITIQLTRKYDCSGALETIRHAVRDWVSFGREPALVFTLAAALDDIDACSMLIRQHGTDSQFEEEEDDSFLGFLSLVSTAFPAAFSRWPPGLWI